MTVSSLLLVLLYLSVLLVGIEATVTPNGGMVWDGNGWLALVDDDSSPLPPPPKSDSWKRPDTTIFLGISSYRDKRCPQTLKNYFTKAKYPERIRIGVVQQNAREDVDCVAEYCKLMDASEGPSCPHYDKIRIVRVEAKLAAGPCYGRHLQVKTINTLDILNCARTVAVLACFEQLSRSILIILGPMLFSSLLIHYSHAHRA